MNATSRSNIKNALIAVALVAVMRVPLCAQSGDRGRVQGVEFAAAVNLPPKDMRVIGTLFLPDKVRRARAVIVVFRWGAGATFYLDPDVRRLSESTESGLLMTEFPTMKASETNYRPRDASLGGADGLVLLLKQLAQESGHQELADAPLLFWGHSAFGLFGPTFAAIYPERTLAMVQYQSGSAAAANVKASRQIPMLFLAGGKDTSVAPVNVQRPWETGRSENAPWTFAVDPDASHGSAESVRKANNLMIPWITAVLRQRLSPDRRTLRVVIDASGWIGNIKTGEVTPYGTLTGSKAEASWLPDEMSARGWRIVFGAAK